MNNNTRPLVSLGTLSMICSTAADRHRQQLQVATTDVNTHSYGLYSLVRRLQALLGIVQAQVSGPKGHGELAPAQLTCCLALSHQPSAASCCALPGSKAVLQLHRAEGLLHRLLHNLCSVSSICREMRCFAASV